MLSAPKTLVHHARDMISTIHACFGRRSSSSTLHAPRSPMMQDKVSAPSVGASRNRFRPWFGPSAPPTSKNAIQYSSVETLNSKLRKWTDAKPTRDLAAPSPIHATSKPGSADAYTPPLSRHPVLMKPPMQSQCQNICSDPSNSRQRGGPRSESSQNAANFEALLHNNEDENKALRNDYMFSCRRKRKHWYCQPPCTHEDSQPVNWRVTGKCYATVLWSAAEGRVASKCHACVELSNVENHGRLEVLRVQRTHAENYATQNPKYSPCFFSCRVLLSAPVIRWFLLSNGHHNTKTGAEILHVYVSSRLCWLAKFQPTRLRPRSPGHKRTISPQRCQPNKRQHLGGNSFEEAIESLMRWSELRCKIITTRMAREEELGLNTHLKHADFRTRLANRTSIRSPDRCMPTHAVTSRCMALRVPSHVGASRS